jgi:hypothetical protein
MYTAAAAMRINLVFLRTMDRKSAHNERVFGLDIYRAAAIILVMLLHGRFILDGTVSERFPFVRIVDGVELFFVLSGFLMGGAASEKLTARKRFLSMRFLNSGNTDGSELCRPTISCSPLIISWRRISSTRRIANFNWRYIFFIKLQ